MKFIQTIKNKVFRMIGTNQTFEELLNNKDINGILSILDNKEEIIINHIKKYNVHTHIVNKRHDKILTNEKGETTGVQKQWRLPINYPKYINEISLVMLFGNPVKWIQETQDSDKAYNKFIEVLKNIRFDYKIRQCKRLAGAESESALLIHWEKDNKGNPDLIAKPLAKSLGDDLYYSKDQFDRLLHFARVYNLKVNNEITKHCDLYTKEKIYRCKKTKLGWNVEVENNLAGKIPVILFQQNTEFGDVNPLIERQEWLASTNADTNDYFSSPILKLFADQITSLPEKNEQGKIIKLKGESGASYLTYDSLPEGKKYEMDFLDKHILRGSFTPNIDYENLKGLSNVSGKALKQLMTLAKIKADSNKEIYGAMLDRFANLIIAIIGNILDVSLKSECNKLIIAHEFQEPFDEDISTLLNDLINATQNNLLSLETAIGLNPYVKNETEEIKKINLDQSMKTERERAVNLFESGY